jgi:hypothetical protein
VQLATRNSQLFFVQLATRNSQLATRSSQRAKSNLQRARPEHLVWLMERHWLKTYHVVSTMPTVQLGPAPTQVRGRKRWTVLSHRTITRNRASAAVPRCTDARPHLSGGGALVLVQQRAAAACPHAPPAPSRPSHGHSHRYTHRHWRE